MAMTPSQLSIIVSSKGVADATVELDKLAKAAASVDSETKAFVIAQSKLAESNQKVSKSSEAAARGVTTQELAMIKLHEQANKMNAVLDKQHAAQQKLVDNVFEKALRDQERDAKKAADALAKQNKEIEKQAEALKKTAHHGSIFNNTLKSMAVAASAYIGVNFIKGVIEQGDAWSLVQSKLSLAVGSMEGAKLAQKDLFEMSQRVRVPLEDSTKLFTRMSVPLQKIGQTTSDVQKVVESFSMALKLSGATGQEASSAMLQLSQSFNAGRLNGGEFNSVAEASPNVLRAIETELIRTGKGADLAAKGLKNLAADGVITTAVMTEALKRAAPVWRKEFESLPITVDGVLTRIKNAWQKAIGEVSLDTKFNEKLAMALMKLEEDLPKIARAIGNAFVFIIDNGEMLLKTFASIAALFAATHVIEAALGFIKLADAVGLVTTAGNLLGLTPIGKVILGISAVIGAGIWVWNKYRDSIQEVTDKTEANKTKIPDIIKSIEEETRALNQRNEKLEMELGLRKSLSNESSGGATLMKKEDLTKYQQAIYDLNMARVHMEDAKKAFSNRKSNVGAEALQQAIIDAEQNFRAASVNIVAARKAYAALKEASNIESANSFLVNRQKTSNALIEQYKSEDEKAKDIRKKSLSKLEQDNALGLVTLTAYNKAKIGIEKEYQDSLEKQKKVKKEPSGMFIDLAKDDLFADTDKRIIEFSKAQEKAIKNSADTLASAEDELAKIRALISGYDDKKQALIDLQISEQELKLASLNRSIADKEEINNINKTIEALKLLKGEQKTLSNLDLNKKETEDAKKRLDDLFNTAKVDKFENASTKALKGIVKGFAELNKALTTYGVKQEKISQARRDNLEVNYGDFKKFSEQEAAITNKEVDYKLASYAEMADAAKNFFTEGTKGYQAMDAVSKIYHAAQVARNLTEMTMMATKGVMNQAAGDVYTAIPRMAAMAAIMAGLGFATGAFGSSGGGGAKAADVQKTQGSGSVFGDSEAKSESIKKSLDLLKSSYDKLYPVNQGMLKALKNIESSMTGLSNLVLRSGGVIEGTNMGIATGQLNAKGSSVDAISSIGTQMTKALFGSNLGGSIAKFINNLWGKTTQNIVDSGIQFGGSLASLQKGQGVNQYASVDTTKSSWFGLKKDTKNSVQTQGLNDELSAQFGLVFTNMQKSLEEAGKVLYGSSKGVTDALDSLVLSTSKISLKGLSGQALTDAINAVISKGLDEMAAAAFKSFDKFRQVGEGYAQTVIRVANNFATVNAVFDKLGMKMYETSDAGIAASMAFVGLFDSLENMQSVASEYYDKFYTEAEKQNKITEALKKQFAEMNLVLPDSAKAYRELVDNTSDPAKIAMLWKLSGAFSEVFGTIEQGAKEIPQAMKDAFDSLSKDAQRWLSIRNQAASLKDEISMAMGNPKKDPAIRMQQLWDAMSKDVTPEQKLQLAGELKDLMLQKYQVEKDSLTKLIDFGKQLRNYVDSLKVGSLSPLTVGQKLAEAQAQYQSTFTKAQGGDTAAQGMLQGKADTYLQLAQTALASSGGYTDIFNEVTNGLDSLGIESMSAAERANQTATEQLAELQRLSDFVGSVEVTANNYYNSSLTALASQITLMDAMYQKMGIFDGMLSSIAGLPAEIAAALSGKVGNSFGNDEFIRNLYQSVEGRVGSQIDAAGYNYWMKDLMTSTKEQVASNFVIASQENNVNRTSSSTSALETQVAALTAEVKGLREDANLQTGAIITAQVMSTETSTTAIVTATKESVVNESWQNSLKPELV